MKIIFDASSLINLIKADALGVVLELGNNSFRVGPVVEGECGSDVPELSAAFEVGSISRADDGELPASVFAALLNLYDLGDGETECLAFADSDPELVVCCDDRAARSAATGRFGDARVVGSLFLLRECVRHQLLTAEQARLAYELMRYRGGFLPDLPDDYFST